MKGRPSVEKRRKERARQERKLDKAARRAERKNQRSEPGDRSEADADPDIAGIVPGPQPLPPEFGVPPDQDAASRGWGEDT